MNTAPITSDFTAEDYLDLIILTTHQSRSPETNPQLAASLSQQDGFILMQLHGILATLLPSAGTARPQLTVWADYVAALHAHKTAPVIPLARTSPGRELQPTAMLPLASR